MRDEQQQQNSGAAAVQINGNYNTVNHHTHQHDHYHQHAHHHLHTVLAPVPVFALQAPPAPPARQGRQRKPPKRDVTPAQREVLALMRPLPKAVRVDVLIWMRYEFGTSLVLDLEPRELYRTRQQVLDARLAHGI